MFNVFVGFVLCWAILMSLSNYNYWGENKSLKDQLDALKNK